MNILLTGASGFIGNALFKQLHIGGHNLTLLVKDETSSNRMRFLPDDRVKIITPGESNFHLLNQLNQLEEIDAVVHAATNYGRNESDVISPFFANISLPITLLQFCITKNIDRFINLDTFFNNGNSSYQYLKSYTLSKKQFSEWGELYSSYLAFINLKLFHVYGPNDDDQKFVPSIIKKCSLGEPIDLTEGTQRRDFIYLHDVINAISLCLRSRLPFGMHKFEIGSGNSISIREFISKVNDIFGNKSVLNFGALQDRPGEMLDSFANIELNNAIDWKSEIDLETGLYRTINKLDL